MSRVLKSTLTLASLVLVPGLVCGQTTKALAPTPGARIDVADDFAFRAVPQAIAGRPGLVLGAPVSQTLRLQRSITVESVTEGGRWRTLVVRYPEGAQGTLSGKEFRVQVGDEPGSIQIEGGAAAGSLAEKDIRQLVTIEELTLVPLPGEGEGRRSYSPAQAAALLSGSGLAGPMTASYRSRTEAESRFDVTLRGALVTPSGAVDLVGSLTVASDGTRRSFDLNGKSRAAVKADPSGGGVEVMVETKYEINATRTLTIAPIAPIAPP